MAVKKKAVSGKRAVAKKSVAVAKKSVAVAKKSVAAKKKAAKKKAAKKKVASGKRVASRKKTVAKKKGSTTAKQTGQVNIMSKPSVRAPGAGSVAPFIPPGFQGQFEEEAAKEPFVPVHQVTKRSEPATAPVSLWNKLEPTAPPQEEEIVEEPAEVDPSAPATLVEQVLMESRLDYKRPFAIQPRFTKPVEVEEEVEPPVPPVVAAQKRDEMSDYLSAWGGQPQPERQAVVEQVMPNDSSEIQQGIVHASEVALTPESTPVVEEPTVETVAPTPAPSVEEPTAEFIAPKPAPVVEEPTAEFIAPKPAPVVEEPTIEPVVSRPDPVEGIAPPLASRTSILDAVHAVATQAQQQSVAAGGESSECVAPEVSHTDQVAEVIRMIEEEETVVVEPIGGALKTATEANRKEQVSAEIHAAIEESDEPDDPHFNEALDKISGTRADDSEALQRREAIRHFTESATKRRTQRRNHVATGAPAIVGGLPPSAGPKDARVEVETLGDGILHLLSSGVKGIASFGRYSLLGVKYGLKDSGRALGRITSKG